MTPKGRNSGTSYLNLPHTYCKGTSMGKQKPEGRGGYLSVRHTAQHPTGSRMEKREGRVGTRENEGEQIYLAKDLVKDSY